MGGLIIIDIVAIILCQLIARAGRNEKQSISNRSYKQNEISRSIDESSRSKALMNHQGKISSFNYE